jgi:lipoate-protein ligase A
MRPCWELHVEPEPRSPLDEMARDLSLVADVSTGRRAAVMRLWQPDRTVVLAADGASRVSQRADVSVVARPTPGPQWSAAGPAAILWSTIATSETFGISETEDPLEAASEWVLASLRQLGIQASLQTGGTILTPMGVVGACAVAKQDGVILAGHRQLCNGGG